MRVLVWGAGVMGSHVAVRLHDTGHEVSLLARGERSRSLQRLGVQIAEPRGSGVRRVRVPVVEHPADGYDLVVVLVRAHQVDAVLPALARIEGDIVFLHNWAAGPEPLAAAVGRDRFLLGFPVSGAGTMDGDVVVPRPSGLVDRLARMPIGEPDGRTTARLTHVVATFAAAGIRATAEPRVDSWLRTHASFEVPLGQAVHAAGGPGALAADAPAVADMVRRMRSNLDALPTRPVPRAFGALQTVPEGVLVAALRRFLRSPLAEPLARLSPATVGEYALLAEQLRS